ncbi:24436_t:CDS:2 [Cetraspora pellucida]|uniref:24436_t:CDS:1 n=1 Tax=Cetraspora pellucida TaxID=1433469 RepID=A0A9N9D714_9GLOM|nr:24436_t:CDS:2 [Cetraspora pellucida]
MLGTRSQEATISSLRQKERLILDRDQIIQAYYGRYTQQGTIRLCKKERNTVGELLRMKWRNQKWKLITTHSRLVSNRLQQIHLPHKKKKENSPFRESEFRFCIDPMFNKHDKLIVSITRL